MEEYLGVALIFGFSYLQHNQKKIFEWVKEIRTMKS
jgi:hypothetical protein